MTDRELLELAAKAAGLRLTRWDDDGQAFRALDYQQTTFSLWNPLTDDGDALRLAVKLGLTICNEHESAGCVYCTRSDAEVFPVVWSGKVGDPPGITPDDYVATRRAVTRAAAEIGRAMP